MSRLRILVLRRFFEHPLRTGLSLAGIGIGTALAVAVFGFLGSLTGSVRQLAAGVAGTADLDVRAASADGLDERRFFDVAGTPGVAAAVPLVRGQVRVAGRRALLIGIDARVGELGTDLARSEAPRLRRLVGGPGIVVAAPLAGELGVRRGDRVVVASASGEREVPVLAVLGGEAARLNGGRVAIAPIPVAQGLLGRLGRIDSVLVVARPGAGLSGLTRRLSAALGPSALVEDPSMRVEQARAATAGVRTGMLMAVAMALVVGGFLVFNTMSMAAAERRRELATLRTLGARRDTLRWVFLIESALIGLAGSAAGSLAGLGVARRLIAAIPPSILSSAGDVNVEFVLPGYALPASIAAGVAVAVLAALLPVERAVRVPPVESMRPEGITEGGDEAGAVSWVPALAGSMLAAAGFAAAVAGPPAIGVPSVVALFAGVILVSYGLAGPLSALAAGLAARLGVAGRLAAAGVERAPRRAWAASAAVIAATAMVVAQTGLFANLTGSMVRGYASLARIDLYVSAGEATGAVQEAALPGDWREDLAAIPGVANVGVHAATFIGYRNRRVALHGIEGSVGADPQLARLPSSDRRRVERGEATVVSARFSSVYGIGRGDVLELPTPSGARRLDVVAVVPAVATDGGMVTIGRRPLVDWFGHAGVADYMLSLDAAADPVEVGRSVERFLAVRGAAAHLRTGPELVEAIRAIVGQTRALFDAMTWVVVGGAVLAILNSLTISVLQRRRELGIMRALGTSRRQLRRMVGIEAAVLGTVGGAGGGIIGSLLHRASLGPLMAPLTREAGFPIRYEFLASAPLLALAAGMLIALVASLAPARRAASVVVVSAIGYE